MLLRLSVELFAILTEGFLDSLQSFKVNTGITDQLKIGHGRLLCGSSYPSFKFTYPLHSTLQIISSRHITVK
jgi:hypothetical protein